MPPAATTPTGGVAGVPRFAAPPDWPTVDDAVLTHGAAVVTGLVDADLRARFNAEVDAWIAAHPGADGPDSGSQLYDHFLGTRTVRVQGLPAKFASGGDVVAHPEIVAWANRMLAPICTSVLLSAGEMVQIGPGETPQYLHRDTDSWGPHLPRGEQPYVVNAMIAFTPFTERNGATRVALGSHRWEDPARRAKPSEVVLAVMEPGDVLFFRSDVIHGGGPNRTEDEGRRGVVLSYCAGWLRAMENSVLSVPPEVARRLPERVTDLLGYSVHDWTVARGGLLGVVDNADPRRLLRSGSSMEPAG
ncbi:Phytanoyl-CoA dioxygenase (PhyH) [Streptoalloteichus tenebrarius]|uniref:Phytanoyl-CoA dioxygenase (PhyH) n=1 Tax=Streptoalloteichus tenebrarius (strain ATCC 17920 / DSM 40477 / JCM 4838 / CBS 697.72 / NBRC 16177 / NCIMB 11028 / NRRL B-12390 / A12253. 1 / ISP 5477) TaxID=1933 RepID=A0ABT1HU60_STRSD|nr:phytanoyl-CoA dioxygenase family protein [Streptoalloteichus tenebrarius]MCP2259054.1 Phytanoyl-CoA dioxygenase (PhyH) [Streptoalloteichus tenebrarius]BFE99620.1 hypothetical protein GCM10020241_12960 [Streptoalloteichus tenebrarius]